MLRYLLGGGTDTSVQAMSLLHPDTPMTIARRVIAPPPAAAPAAGRSGTRSCSASAQRSPPEISAGKVSAEQNADAYLRARRQRGAVPGRAGDGARRVQADRGAHCADPREGARRHQGRRAFRQHAASTPCGFRRTSSLGRAGEGGAAVLFKPLLSKPDRIEVEGKGADRSDRAQRDAAGPRQQPARRDSSSRAND